ncbi:hypothetical protein HDV06_002100 [Boothiomyces sp. JEL0866]|nr:hypothetical protein HDV06_002100 [Boothiomyces sp. JEL0866]
MNILEKLRNRHTTTVKQTIKNQWDKIKEIGKHEPQFDLIEIEIKEIESDLLQIKQKQQEIVKQMESIDK